MAEERLSVERIMEYFELEDERIARVLQVLMRRDLFIRSLDNLPHDALVDFCKPLDEERLQEMEASEDASEQFEEVIKKYDPDFDIGALIEREYRIIKENLVDPLRSSS